MDFDAQGTSGQAPYCGMVLLKGSGSDSVTRDCPFLARGFESLAGIDPVDDFGADIFSNSCVGIRIVSENVSVSGSGLSSNSGSVFDLTTDSITDFTSIEDITAVVSIALGSGLVSKSITGFGSGAGSGSGSGSVLVSKSIAGFGAGVGSVSIISGSINSGSASSGSIILRSSLDIEPNAGVKPFVALEVGITA